MPLLIRIPPSMLAKLLAEARKHNKKTQNEGAAVDSTSTGKSPAESDSPLRNRFVSEILRRAATKDRRE